MKYKVFLETLGCSKNQVDSEVMIGLLRDNQYVLTPYVDEAEIIIVNTCGFIESAKEESVNTMLELLQFKNDGKCQYFIATGCLAERYAEELKAELPEVDAFVGTSNFDEILNIIDDVLNGESVTVHTGDLDKVFDENLPRVILNPPHFAYLKIAEGCDNSCTYCIIPKLRGPFRSRKHEDIVSEAERLVSNGVKELILIAQDTSRYGMDLYGEYRLAELLRALNDIEDLKWIRIQYAYPDVIDEKLIYAMRDLDKVVKYLDIPVQHASNRVLKRMNRTTSKEDIESLLLKLRQEIPNIVIRTTLIAGFPGETEEDFMELYNFVKEMKFDKLGVFSYSLEEDTPAEHLDGHLEQDVKDERRDRIMALQMGISDSNMEKYVGQTMEVLVEEVAEENAIYVARTQFDAPEIDGVCYVHTKEALQIGTFYNVVIRESMEYDLIGDLL